MLSGMKHIFHVENDPRVKEYVAAFDAEESNIFYLYEDGKPRETAYQEICNTIVKEALRGIDCAYLTPGNPIFLNSVVLKLREAALQNDIPFAIYPGISSIDTILTELFLSTGSTGLQCYEATHFVDFQPKIDIRVPLLLFQPSVVNMSNVHYHKGTYFPGVKLLQNALIDLYGANQKWCLLKSAMSQDETPFMATGTLSELTAHAELMNLGTLFIPGDWDGVDTFPK